MPTLAETHDAWMDAFFASYYEHRPVNATFIGEHDYDSRLPDLSEEATGDVLAEGRRLLSEVRGAAPDAPPAASERDGEGPAQGGLTPAQALDGRLAEGFLEIQEWELVSSHFHRANPTYWTGEAVFGVLGLFLTDYAPLEERVSAATSRMRGLSAFLSQGRDHVRAAPAGWTERAIRECDGGLALFGRGMKLLAQESGVDDRAFAAAADEAARALSEFRSYLASHVLRRDTDEYAAGEKALDLHIRRGHFLEQSAQDIAAYARDQLAEARGYLEAHASDFGAQSPEAALAGLADLHPDPTSYYGRYQEIWDQVRSVAEERELLTWPDVPIRYVPRPNWVREAAPYLYFLFYRSPAAVNRPPVHDYLVAPLDESWTADEMEAFLRSNNDSVIKLNHVVHHGGLGHHVQNWHAFRAESRVGRMAAVDCASRIAMLCGGTMAEGWACYATDLAAEAGALTPLEQYGEMHSRVRMAARAVVDVELHSERMGLEEAVTFYQEHAGMSEAGARGEALKNSMFPGGALMYLMGTDAIHGLREEMMRRQGPDFDLCGFHDRFLSFGSVPVSLIAQAMLAEEGGSTDAE